TIAAENDVAVVLRRRVEEIDQREQHHHQREADAKYVARHVRSVARSRLSRRNLFGPLVAHHSLKLCFVGPTRRPTPCSACVSAGTQAGTVAASQNSARAIAGLPQDRGTGLVMRKVGSGRVPVNSRSGNAVIKITGTENSARMSFTASIPLESSASWISASTSPGGCWRACATASSRVTATPVTLWPRSRTIVSISIAMIAPALLNHKPH